MYAIKVHNLSKTYKNGIQALSGLNIQVKSGEIYSLLGENGAGKSTLIKILTTFLKPTSGNITMLGKDIQQNSIYIRSNIACVSQQTSIDANLSLEENNIVKFPDAKTDRGVKHVKELIKAKEDGYLAYIIIVIQMKDVLYFTPNIERHKEFKDVLKEADEKGVKILAYDSIVNIDNIKLNKPVKVVL